MGMVDKASKFSVAKATGVIKAFRDISGAKGDEIALVIDRATKVQLQALRQVLRDKKLVGAETYKITADPNSVSLLRVRLKKELGLLTQVLTRAAAAAAEEKPAAAAAAAAIRREAQAQVFAALSGAGELATAHRELEGAVAARESELAGLKKAVAARESELEALQRRNEMLNKSVEEHNQAIADLHTAKDNTIATLRSEKEGLDAKVALITAEAAQAKTDKEELTRTFDEATKQQAASALSALKAVKKKAEKAERELDQVNGQLEVKQTEIAELKKSSKKDNAELQAKLDEATRLQAENAENIVTATQQVTAATAELENLRKSLFETEEKLRLSAAENDSLRADAAQQDTALQAAERAASDLQQQLDDAAETHKEELRAHEDSFETLKRTIDAIYELRDRLTEPMKQRNKVLHEIFDAGNPAYSDNQERLDAGKDAVDKFNETLSEEEARVILREVKIASDARKSVKAKGGGASAAEGVDLAPRWAPLRF